MSYCFASSRDSTITFFGSPCSPDNIRRTNTRPMEPVPPVTRTRLPSNTRSLVSIVRGGIGDHLFQHRLPGGSDIACVLREAVHYKATIAGEFAVNFNLHRVMANF